MVGGWTRGVGLVTNLSSFLPIWMAGATCTFVRCGSAGQGWFELDVLCGMGLQVVSHFNFPAIEGKALQDIAGAAP